MRFGKTLPLATLVLLLTAGAASATDVTYYTGDIWAGQTIDIGTISATMHCTGADSVLEIKYETTGGWRLTECHVWVGTVPPGARGAPGQYHYHSGTINTTSYSFFITIAELRSRFGLDWGLEVYVMPHCAVFLDGDSDGEYDNGEQTETGYGGTVVKPKRGAWYGFFGFALTRPQQPVREVWDLKTMAPDYWRDNFHDEIWYPVTLAGTEFASAAAAQAFLATALSADPYLLFLRELVAFYCNLMRIEELELAYYDHPDYSGEFMENENVGYIFTVANSYSATTNQATILLMKDVLQAINNNGKSTTKVLWNGPAGKPVALGSEWRIMVHPNPFTNSTKILFQHSPGAEVRVGVYDLSGKRVNELTGSGNQAVWNGTDRNGRELAAGVYLLRVEGSGSSASARVVINR